MIESPVVKHSKANSRDYSSTVVQEDVGCERGNDEERQHGEQHAELRQAP